MSAIRFYGPLFNNRKLLHLKLLQVMSKAKTLTDVSNVLKKGGIESCNLIVGIDFTKSNTWHGEKTFGGKSLHDPDVTQPNPYAQVLRIICTTLAPFDEDGHIPAFGFGDIITKDKAIFPFYEDYSPCEGLEGVTKRYYEILPSIQLNGPTNFGPLIREAIKIVSTTRSYHILLIIADGEVDCEDDTVDAISEASNYPLSIITVGVGDGPWGLMEKFDKSLQKRKFDNFHFVNFHACMKKKNAEVVFSLEALKEIPMQHKTLKRLKFTY